MPEAQHSSSNRLIVRGALLLCVVALPIVAFNLFASSQQNESFAYWALALTASFAVLASVFILFASRRILAQWSSRNLLPAQLPSV